MPVYDFHTHTSLSDGVLSPIELIRRAHLNGYRAIALTDHTGMGYLARLISEVARDCALAEEYWGITALPGVELTHVPAQAIAEAARQAKEMGALLVVIHGETLIEPVEPGTNLAAVKSPHVDILAHPGLLTLEEAGLAAANGIFMEICARKGHSLANGHVAKIARQASARLLVNSDAHEEADLLTPTLAQKIAQGAGLSDDEINQVLKINPDILLDKLRK